MLSTDANPRGNHEQINVHGRIDSAASSTVDRRLGYEFDDDGPIKATDEIVPPPIHTHFLSSHTTATPQLSQPLQPSLHPSRPQVKRPLYLPMIQKTRLTPGSLAAQFLRLTSSCTAFSLRERREVSIAAISLCRGGKTLRRERLVSWLEWN